MKRLALKIVAAALAVMCVVVPVSAKTAGDAASGTGPALPDGAPNLVDWYENWDSYGTDVSVHGLGGWKGWNNNPAATAYTRDEQKISVPNSIEITGASDLVHEYTIDDGVWTYTTWQHVPVNFSGTSYFILLNDYDDACASCNWSVQVEFDSASNSVINDGVSGGTLTLITGQWVEIRVEIDLVADIQSFYYGGVLLYSGSWSAQQSPYNGITSIGAVDLYANSAAPVYYDDLSLVEAGVQMPMHIGDIWGFFHLDPYGRVLLQMYVTVHDADHIPLGEVAVDGSIWWPAGGPVARTRVTKPVNGTARFHWGSNVLGLWQLCVDGLTKAGYVYVPGANDVPNCAQWNN